MLLPRPGKVATVVTAVILLCVLVCFYTWALFRFTPDAKTGAINDVQCILSSIQSNPGTPLPKHCGFFLGDKCAAFLEQALSENAGKHITQVTYYNWDDSKYDYRDVDIVEIGVFFPNGLQATFDFYQGGLDRCGEEIPKNPGQ